MDLADEPFGNVVAPDGARSVDVLCPADHPVNAWVERWVESYPYAMVRRSVNELPSRGDFLFLISCSEIIKPEVRQRFRHVLVIHASDLPKDRGWSPHVWTILEGGNELVVSLLECTDPVDSGDIWHQERVSLDGTETFNEISAKLFDAEMRLMDWAVRGVGVKPRPQEGDATYRRKRTPADSEVTPDKTLAEIFDLLRVCDPERYPVSFEHRGSRYALTMARL